MSTNQFNMYYNKYIQFVKYYIAIKRIAIALAFMKLLFTEQLQKSNANKFTKPKRSRGKIAKKENVPRTRNVSFNTITGKDNSTYRGTNIGGEHDSKRAKIKLS